jgi:hypothetical protein
MRHASCSVLACRGIVATRPSVTTVTGLIYLVIIALWAAVLIPMWLRRHDQISEVRSTARFSSAMRSLGSNGQPQYAMSMSGGPMTSSVPEVPVARPINPSRAEGVDPTYERELARQSAATRRAVVLGILTAVLLVALVAAMIGVLPKWAPVLAALPVIGFVVAAAMTASQRSSAGSSRPARAPRRADRASGAQAEAAPSVESQSDEEWQNWNAWDEDESSWEAVPTTLPTYVSAPRASAVPRGIDRATPGEWTGSAMVETAQAMRTRRASAPLSDPSDIDHGAATAEIPVVRDEYEARRAVNE